jgi:Protein of unknown function (DUF1177)
MSFAAVLAALDLLDSPTAFGAEVAAALHAAGVDDVEVVPLRGKRGGTDVVRAVVPGTRGCRAGADAPPSGSSAVAEASARGPPTSASSPTADGAVAMTPARSLGRMRQHGDGLPGDVILATHVCPDALFQASRPRALVGSPVDGALRTARRFGRRFFSCM